MNFPPYLATTTTAKVTGMWAAQSPKMYHRMQKRAT